MKVKARYIRIAPRKVRLVADMVRGENVVKAKSILRFTVNRSALPIAKLLNSAVASARNEFNWDEKNLRIEKITVDEGPKIKRWMPRARGSASPIQKKTSHITLILSEVEKTKSVAKKKISVETQKVGSLKEVKDLVGKKSEKKMEEVKPLPEKKTITKMFRRKSI
jgi:large subunit ribosomal protein L22